MFTLSRGPVTVVLHGSDAFLVLLVAVYVEVKTVSAVGK